jgi:predicted O-methyltransferase YrrM
MEMKSTPEAIYARESTNRLSDIFEHLPALRAEAHGNVLEIGVRGGASTSALILGVRERGGHVYSVDITAACGTDVFLDDPQWTFLHGHSEYDAARILSKVPISLDVLFIDADHSYRAVQSDLAKYGPRVRKGGVILLHDTELEGAGVRRALVEYAEKLGSVPELRPGCYGLGVLRI